MSGVSDRLCQLAGADLDVLDHARSDRTKLTALGLVLVFTASVAALSMVFALRNAVFVVVDPETWAPAAAQPISRLVVAIVLGLVWGLFILALDRALIITMQDVSGPRVLLYAIPRLLLAFVIGVVVAVPLTIQIFHAEVIDIVKQNNIERVEEGREKIQGGPAAQSLAKVREEIAAQELILSGTIDAVSTPEFVAAQAAHEQAVAAEAKARDTRDAKYRAMLCEREGAGSRHPDCEGVASDTPGEGELFAARQREYDAEFRNWSKADEALRAAERELETARIGALSASKGSLADAQQQASIALCGLLPDSEPPTANPKCDTGLRAQEKAIDATLQGMLEPSATLGKQGLSQQISALFELGSAHLWIAGLFMVVEMAPVIVKVFMAYKGESQYDRVARKLRDEEYASIESDIEEKQAIRDRAVRKREKIRDDMLNREIALGTTANKHVVAEMEVILKDALREWSDQIRESHANNPPASGASAPLPQNGANQPSPYGLPDEATL